MSKSMQTRYPLFLLSNALLTALILGVTPRPAPAIEWTTERLSPGGITQPQGVIYTRGIYDSVNDRFITAFGTTGSTCNTSQDQLFALEFAPNDKDGFWYRLQAGSPKPSVRSSQFMVYDVNGPRLFLFGGSDVTCNPLSDVWELKLTKGIESWRRLNVSGTPPSGSRHGYVIFDTSRTKLIYFGGERFYPTESYYNETFSLDLSVPGEATWQRIIPQGNPPPARSQGVAAYAIKGNRMLIFGGGRDHYGTSRTYYNDVWSLQLTPGNESWTQLQAVGAPPAPRAGCLAEYVPEVSSLMIFGGVNANQGGFSDFFTMNLNAQPVWEVVAPTGFRLPARWNMASAYDSKRKRVLLFGGGTGNPLDSLSWTGTSDVYAINVQVPTVTPSPTFPPTPTATPTPPQPDTPTPTATQPGVAAPRLRMAGYMNSELSASQAGMLMLTAIVYSESPVSALELRAGGTVTGTSLPLVNNEQSNYVYQLGPIPVEAIGTETRVLYELLANTPGGSNSGLWPYLNVR